MTLYTIPEFKDRTSPLDACIGRLLFMFGQLDEAKVGAIIDRVHRALPVQVPRKAEDELDEEGAAMRGRDAVAQRGVVQLLYLIAAQSYADILFALTYAESLAMMNGANFDTQGAAH